jgi:diguanylate cyclase (GGDEF)-like protein/PAS domain S-box-containing protein
VQPADPDPAHPADPGEAFFRVLLEDHTDVIVVLGEDGTIRYATPSAAALFGHGPIVGARLPDLVGDEDRPGVSELVDQMLGRYGPDPRPGGERWRIAVRDGRDVYLHVRISDLRGATAVGGLVLTLRDVTSQVARENELQHQALYDARTGLPNAQLFEDRAAHAAALARRNGATAAVMLVDLDNFKNVNDTLGHLAGNQLLAAAGARMASAVRQSDTTARWGGDEFAILLENLPDPAAAGVFADRVVQAFRAPFSLAAGQITITVSVGVATTADSADPAGLLANADVALYAAKTAGKQTWRAYDPAEAARTFARLGIPGHPGMAGRRPPAGSAGPRRRAARGDPGRDPDREAGE